MSAVTIKTEPSSFMIKLDKKQQTPPRRISYYNKTLDLSPNEMDEKLNAMQNTKSSMGINSTYSPNSTEVLCNLDPNKIGMISKFSNFESLNLPSATKDASSKYEMPNKLNYPLAPVYTKRTEDYVNITLGLNSDYLNSSLSNRTITPTPSADVSIIQDKLSSFTIKDMPFEKSGLKLPKNMKIDELSDDIKNKYKTMPVLNFDGFELFKDEPTFKEILDYYTIKRLGIPKKTMPVRLEEGPISLSRDALLKNNINE